MTTLRQSVFQAREMLLDYYENKLDASRTELVKKALASDVETERALNQITRGLEFSKQLSKVQLNLDFKEQLMQSENMTSLFSRYSRFSNWSQAFRVSTFAVLGCAFLVVVVMSLPRNLILKLKHRPNQEVVLSQLPKTQDLAVESDDPEKRDAQAIVAQNLPADTDEDEGNGTEGASAGEAEASGDDHVEAPATPPPAVEQPTQKVAAEAASKEAENNVSDKDTKGYIYRANMKIDGLDERVPQITQQIVDLGGKKAGEVELGWKKNNKGSYYHFTLPEENYAKLEDYLRAFGPVRFSKEPHPRVMPQGQIRIILWVERKNE